MQCYAMYVILSASISSKTSDPERRVRDRQQSDHFCIGSSEFSGLSGFLLIAMVFFYPLIFSHCLRGSIFSFSTYMISDEMEEQRPIRDRQTKGELGAMAYATRNSKLNGWGTLFCSCLMRSQITVGALLHRELLQPCPIPLNLDRGVMATPGRFSLLPRCRGRPVTTWCFSG
ncbi:hypothetical protein F4821DRAFT_95942 [Hypoxylon rubiginosum]|uniref:Uncharacterized protein n=1 Tax=Hypoxylon rubiginosum TaxID=110542 RepID=A0ACC0D5W5_9PEZI|nr:hypothetical protein F4821DRAFT_95942 [Hypoxylon rubiginosum]